jgi:hypothetical protein
MVRVIALVLVVPIAIGLPGAPQRHRQLAKIAALCVALTIVLGPWLAQSRRLQHPPSAAAAGEPDSTRPECAEPLSVPAWVVAVRPAISHRVSDRPFPVGRATRTT